MRNDICADRAGGGECGSGCAVLADVQGCTGDGTGGSRDAAGDAGQRECTDHIAL